MLEANPSLVVTSEIFHCAQRSASVLIPLQASRYMVPPVKGAFKQCASADAFHSLLDTLHKLIKAMTITSLLVAILERRTLF